MDLTFNPRHEAFRDEVKRFFDEKLTDELREAGRLCAGIYSDYPIAVRWHRILNDQGWAVPSWPVEHGGTGWDVVQSYIYQTEYTKAEAPPITPNATRMVGPVIIAYGCEAQKAEYLPRIRSGDDWWAQGYSEPGSGSDLASLQLKAESDGDDYVLNGTKIWTTHAHFSNKMFALVRTENSGKPQTGITFLLLDLNVEGITIDPIISISGDHELNQVFFDNVRVPKSNRLGEEDDGWTVAKYLLGHERMGAYAARLYQHISAIKRIATKERSDNGSALVADPAFARALAQTEAQINALEFTEHRFMSALSQGKEIGPESSMSKIMGTELRQQLTELEMEAIQHYAFPLQHAERQPGSILPYVGSDYALTTLPLYLNTRAASIYAGSNEIQRNIMAKAVLGL
jgi:alkylation response protein AidB-like acyl-CoA dehydrogenase